MHHESLGQYSSSAGQEACSPCPEGTFTANTGTVQCGKCPKGQFAATNGSVACTDCAAGTVASEEGMVRRSDGRIIQESNLSFQFLSVAFFPTILYIVQDNISSTRFH